MAGPLHFFLTEFQISNDMETERFREFLCGGNGGKELA
jgi:hypothetical protein